VRRLALVLLVSCSTPPGETADAGRDVVEAATVDAPADAPACTSQLVVVGGSTTTLFTANGPALSPLTAVATSGSLYGCNAESGCANPIAMTPYGAGILAAITTASGALEWAELASGAWTSPSAVGSVVAADGPSLAAIATIAHLVYQAPGADYFHAQFAAGSWISTTDPVGGTSSQTSGTRGPQLAAVGSDLETVYVGSGSTLYDEIWNSAWLPATEHASASADPTVAPTLIALSGGASELLVAYLSADGGSIMSMARTNGTWDAAPTKVASGPAHGAVALARLSTGRALIVYRGIDQTPYWATWNGAGVWSSPLPIVPTSNPVIAGLPAATAGACGVDAFAAFAVAQGGVETAAFANGTFEAPVTVAGTEGAEIAAVATTP